MASERWTPAIAAAEDRRHALMDTTDQVKQLREYRIAGTVCSSRPPQRVLGWRSHGPTPWRIPQIPGRTGKPSRYQVSVKTINEHFQNIYGDDELAPEATIRKFRIVQTEGKRAVSRLIDHYRLEAILAVGYRVRSTRGVQFRRWATTRLQEYLVKGFVMDDERLKESRNLGADYFDELLQHIRDTRLRRLRTGRCLARKYRAAEYWPFQVRSVCDLLSRRGLAADFSILGNHPQVGMVGSGLPGIDSSAGGSPRKPDRESEAEYLKPIRQTSFD